MKEWKVKGSEEIFSCRLFSLRKDRALSPRTGRELDFYVIDTMDWVGVIPLMGDRVVMV
ncbi:MAG: NUDIX hydrolase, partial [Deltaproteobacteria bacterium]